MAKTTGNSANTSDRVVREPSDITNLERDGGDAANKAGDARPAGDADAGRTPDTLPKQ
jgi:hypothetical protein